MKIKNSVGYNSDNIVKPPKIKFFYLKAGILPANPWVHKWTYKQGSIAFYV
jgi:hypothetical protein